MTYLTLAARRGRLWGEGGEYCAKAELPKDDSLRLLPPREGRLWRPGHPDHPPGPGGPGGPAGSAGEQAAEVISGQPCCLYFAPIAFILSFRFNFFFVFRFSTCFSRLTFFLFPLFLIQFFPKLYWPLFALLRPWPGRGMGRYVP